MIRALRRSRFASLVAVFALFTALPAAFPALHDDSDDVLCNPALVVHDHSAHRIGASASTQPAPEHCFICHWLQSHRGATATSRFVPPQLHVVSLSSVDVVRRTATFASRRSARAPPLA